MYAGAPVHKPGVVALRPLTLGDFFDGAFKTIRRNPKAMVGLSAAVATAFMVVPVLVTLAIALSGSLRAAQPFTNPGPGGDFTSAFRTAMGSGGYAVASNLGGLFGFFAGVVLNGMLVRVVAEAVLGRRTTIGEAWAAVKGRLLRLLGLTLLNLLVSIAALAVPVLVGVAVGIAVGGGRGIGIGIAVGVVLLLGGVVLLLFLQVRYFMLAAPALVLERLGVVASMRRGAQLSRGQWWRLFGILLLTGLVVGVVGQVFAIPLALLTGFAPSVWPGTGGALVAVFSSYLAQVLISAVTTPFSSGVVALQYIDQRIRKEGLDVQLIAAAQPAGGAGS